jgi:hypothetical protein
VISADGSAGIDSAELHRRAANFGKYRDRSQVARPITSRPLPNRDNEKPPLGTGRRTRAGTGDQTWLRSIPLSRTPFGLSRGLYTPKIFRPASRHFPSFHVRSVHYPSLRCNTNPYTSPRNRYSTFQGHSASSNAHVAKLNAPHPTPPQPFTIAPI